MSTRKVIGTALALFAVLYVVAYCHGCAVVQRAQNAVDVVGYSKALDVCLAEGKDAGSITAYEACAKKADVKYGLHDAGGE